ncbi:response regulator [Halorarum halophilum]|uniref:Response regulator n=1 Tax=Halorarum halophilum TaxID=2743090 RepID=A0A7D5KEU7_9EURY|nr:response regulator [Halobaculum halophilum]QLG27116.1 response regulator [Halobaculum halophilum]
MGRAPSEEMVDILLVEDNPGDVRLTEEAFKDACVKNELHTARRGGEALDFLHQRGDFEDATRPDIVLLDLNLPGRNGKEVLEEIRTTPKLKPIPVIVLTSSTADEDIVRSYVENANAYLTKPVDAEEFIDLVRTISEFWIQIVHLPPTEG